MSTVTNNAYNEYIVGKQSKENVVLILKVTTMMMMMMMIMMMNDDTVKRPILVHLKELVVYWKNQENKLKFN